jgi:hypothetical protein
MLQPTIHARPPIDDRIAMRVDPYLDQPPEAIQRRLAQLDRQWTIGGAALASMIAAGGAALAAALRRRLHKRGVLAVAALELGLMWLQRHGDSNALLRKLGVRSPEEIASERAELERLLAEWMRIRGGASAATP